MDPRGLVLPMLLRALALLALLALPLGAANVSYSGAVPNDQPGAPQLHCELVQTTARTTMDPVRCDVAGASRSAMVLRARGAGTGSLIAFVHDHQRTVQVAYMECTVVGAANCNVPLVGRYGVTSSDLELHAVAYGPGGASWVVTVEKSP